MRADAWFPAIESNNVLGRFVDIEKEDTAASEKAGHKITVMRPLLQAKVTGSHDISTQIVKPFNQNELAARFPGAWENYQAHKAKGLPKPEVEIPVIEQSVPGTPLHEADFLPKDRIAWLMQQDIQTIEQLRDLSDIQIQKMGHGVSKWRKQAGDWLKRT